MSAQEKAEVFLIIIKRLFKWFIWAVVILLALALLLIGYIEAADYYKVGRHEKRVAVTVSINKAVCPGKDFPLFIAVANRSGKVLRSVNVEVIVTKTGHSTRLNDYGGYVLDKILKPGESVEYCYQVLSRDRDQKTFRQLPLDGEGLSAELSYRSITFE